MTKQQMQDLIKIEVMNIADKVDLDDYRSACDDASRETGWSFPVSGDFKIHWMKERAKRHLFFYLLTQHAKDYKFEKNEMQQRFSNFLKLVEFMDAAYENIQKQRPDQFTNASVYELFGTKIDAGFKYNSVGKDITYSSDNEVIATPNEES